MLCLTQFRQFLQDLHNYRSPSIPLVNEILNAESRYTWLTKRIEHFFLDKNSRIDGNEFATLKQLVVHLKADIASNVKKIVTVADSRMRRQFDHHLHRIHRQVGKLDQELNNAASFCKQFGMEHTQKIASTISQLPIHMDSDDGYDESSDEELSLSQPVPNPFGSDASDINFEEAPHPKHMTVGTRKVPWNDFDPFADDVTPPVQANKKPSHPLIEAFEQTDDLTDEQYHSLRGQLERAVKTIKSKSSFHGNLLKKLRGPDFPFFYHRILQLAKLPPKSLVVYNTQSKKTPSHKLFEQFNARCRQAIDGISSAEKQEYYFKLASALSQALKKAEKACKGKEGKFDTTLLNLCQKQPNKKVREDLLAFLKKPVAPSEDSDSDIVDEQPLRDVPAASPASTPVLAAASSALPVTTPVTLATAPPASSPVPVVTSVAQTVDAKAKKTKKEFKGKLEALFANGHSPQGSAAAPAGSSAAPAVAKKTRKEKSNFKDKLEDLFANGHKTPPKSRSKFRVKELKKKYEDAATSKTNGKSHKKKSGNHSKKEDRVKEELERVLSHKSDQVVAPSKSPTPGSAVIAPPAVQEASVPKEDQQIQQLILQIEELRKDKPGSSRTQQLHTLFGDMKLLKYRIYAEIGKEAGKPLDERHDYGHRHFGDSLSKVIQILKDIAKTL